MQSINSIERRKKIITLGILLTVTVILLIILAASFRQFGTEDDTNISSANKSAGINLLSINEALHNRFSKLQQFDEQFAGMLTDSSKEKNFPSVNLAIAKQEESFRSTIDSLEKVIDKIGDENTKDLSTGLLNSYKSLLQSRKSITTLRNAVAVSNPAFSADEKKLLQLQNELMDKDEKISDLETSLAIAQTQKPQASVPTAVSANLAASETKLKENMVLLENKIASLTESNNELKSQNDQLKQKSEPAKNSALPDADLKARNASLQQKVDDLNAELRLAQVDCNLSRVDATQIISNSRQRKQLLSEASSILTDLSTTNNSDVQRKVKDKIAKLNQVAANSRE